MFKIRSLTSEGEDQQDVFLATLPWIEAEEETIISIATEEKITDKIIFANLFWSSHGWHGCLLVSEVLFLFLYIGQKLFRKSYNHKTGKIITNVISSFCIPQFSQPFILFSKYQAKLHYVIPDILRRLQSPNKM